MFSGGSNFALTEDQISGLADMLDPQNAASKLAFKNRPASQAVGYSLSEAPVPGGTSTGGATSGPQGAVVPATPGAVHVPYSVTVASSNLPVASGSKAAAAKLEKEKARSKPKGNAIWADDEVDPYYGSTLGDKAMASSADAREAPEYDVVYSQSQSAEDTYLGADFTRDGSAAMSDTIVIKIKLPKTEASKELELDVEPLWLHLRSKDYKLKAPLPVKVVEKKAAAKWDVVNKTLSVTLTVDPSQRQVKIV
jgi:hypothetical protein